MRLLTATIILLLAFAVPGFARESGIQITHQGPQIILIQKDVGSERWAINLSLEETSPMELTGHVFRGDGSPIFIQCRPVDVFGSGDIRNMTVIYNCYAADTCRAAPCTQNQWSFVAEVPISGSFFVP